MAEDLPPTEPGSELSPTTLIVNKNKAVVANRCASAFDDLGFSVYDQGYRNVGEQKSADMFRDADSAFLANLRNDAGHVIQLMTCLLDDLPDVNPLYRTEHPIKDDLKHTLSSNPPDDQSTTFYDADDPTLTFYVTKNLPAYQEDEGDAQNFDTYVVRSRFRSPEAEAASNLPIWTPPKEFVTRVRQQIEAALAEKVDYAHAQEVYKSALAALQNPDNSQPIPPLFHAEVPKPRVRQEPQRFEMSDLRLTPRDAVNQLIYRVRGSMSQAELDRLPADTAGYIDAIVGRALQSPDQFKSPLEEAIILNFYGNPQGERFILDPQRNGPLFVDEDNEIVSLLGAKIITGGSGYRHIDRFDSYDVLTGPNKGKNFGNFERPLPAPHVPPEFFKGYTGSGQETP